MAIVDTRSLSPSVERSVWDDVLRAYAAALDEHRAFLLSPHPEGFEHGQDLLGFSFVPPVGLPPCPVELLGRMEALQADTDGLVAYAADLLQQLQTAAQGLRPSAAAAASAYNDGPSFMDARL